MSQKQYRVALVDDEISFLDRGSALLSNSDDFDIVYKTSDAEEALKAISDDFLDVAVIDVNLRWLNGFTISRKLIEQEANLKVIIVSESDSKEFKTLSKDVGAVGFLPKELFSADAVRSMINVVS